MHTPAPGPLHVWVPSAWNALTPDIHLACPLCYSTLGLNVTCLETSALTELAASITLFPSPASLSPDSQYTINLYVYMGHGRRHSPYLRKFSGLMGRHHSGPLRIPRLMGEKQPLPLGVSYSDRRLTAPCGRWEPLSMAPGVRHPAAGMSHRMLTSTGSPRRQLLYFPPGFRMKGG